MNNQSSHERKPVLAIIGNGITGITAARVARKILPDLEIHIISGETDYFYSRTALMYIYMGHMRAVDTEPYERDFYPKNRLNLIRDFVERVDTGNQTLHMQSGSNLKYDYLLLATGSKSNKFGWPGQDLDGVQGLYSMQDLELLEENTRAKPERAVIVGGGLIGIELAEMLHTRDIPVTFLVRESSYMEHVFPPGESDMINREIRKHHIDLRFNTNLKEILDDGSGRCKGVVVAETGETIDCGLVGLTPGVSPNLAALADDYHDIETQRGILVDNYLRTNVDGVYAAGDCAQFKNPDGSGGRIEPLWYRGRMQAAVAARSICESALKNFPGLSKTREVTVEEYDSGINFNSAKFFNIEWQIYGDVPAKLDENKTFFWEEPGKSRAIRLVWDTNGSDTKITGFNLMGLRYRHEVCEEWIREERSVDYVVKNLKKANFDPEFFSAPEKSFAKAFKARA